MLNKNQEKLRKNQEKLSKIKKNIKSGGLGL